MVDSPSPPTPPPPPDPADDPRRPRQGDRKPGSTYAGGSWLSIGQMATSGIELGLTVALLTLLGWWLDKQWNTSPWLLIAGAFIGATGSIYKMYRANKRWYQDDNKKP